MAKQEEWNMAAKLDRRVDEAELDYENIEDWDSIAHLTGEMLPWEE